MDILGTCKTEGAKSPGEFFYGEMQTTALTPAFNIVFSGVNPTPWLVIPNLTEDLNNGFNIVESVPGPSTIEAKQNGVYRVHFNVTMTKITAGGERDMELSTFVNGVFAGNSALFSIGGTETITISFSDIFTSGPGAVFDLRLRKLTGSDVTVTIERVNIGANGFAV